MNLYSAAIVILLMQRCYCYTFYDVDRLLKYLFNETRYNKNIRPATNQSLQTQVNITQQLVSIEEVNVANGYIVTTNILQVTWFDDYLAWDTSDFGGIAQLPLPRDVYWKPEFMLASGSSNDETAVGQMLSPAFVRYDGRVVMIPAGYFKTKCETDTSYFPFDMHVCYFQILCSNYDTNDVVLNQPDPNVDISKYTTNNEWTIETTSADTMIFINEVSMINLSLIANNLTVKRRPSFELIHSFIPLMLLLILCEITCLVPVDSGERITFSITVFLSFVFMSSNIVDDLPRNSVNISMSSYLMICGSVTTTLGVLWSVTVVRLSKLTIQQSKIPTCLSRLTLLTVLRHQRQSNKVDTHKVQNDKVTDMDQPTELENENREKDKNNTKDIIETERQSTQDGTINVSWSDVSKMLDICYFLSLCIFMMVPVLAYVGILVSKNLL